MASFAQAYKGVAEKAHDADSDKKPMVQFLESYLPEGTEHDMAIFVRKFAPRTVLSLIFLISPDSVSKHMIGDKSPNAHTILIELIHSARHSCFLKLLNLVVTRVNPTDE